MTAGTESITRSEFNDRLQGVATKADIEELRGDVKEMRVEMRVIRWGGGILLTLLIGASQAADIIAAIKS